MGRKVQAILRQEQADLLLSGQSVSIRLPGVDITEVELKFELTKTDSRRKNSSGLFDDFGDMFSGFFKSK